MTAMRRLPLLLLAVGQCALLAAAGGEFNLVTCGSVVKLVNGVNQFRLHSHDVKYGSGSGQQSVTATPDREDVNSYWTVKGTPERACSRGVPIKCGSSLRLEHLETKKNLHSHLFKSPLSSNQEISAFGRDGEGDSGDNWTVVCSGEHWTREASIRLKHVDTEMLLSLSGRTYGRPISGQAEVVGISYQDASSSWSTEEGAFIKPVEGSAEESAHEEL